MDPEEQMISDWAALGIGRFRRYLEHHAAFEAWLAATATTTAEEPHCPDRPRTPPEDRSPR